MTGKLFPVWIDDATFRSLLDLRRADGERMYRWSVIPEERAKPAKRRKRAEKKRA